ncbi:MAG: hypothetical protein IH801_06830 [Nitrospinae bacterium]|nr:hypothetical protein [Nitrospinota bacterium]
MVIDGPSGPYDAPFTFVGNDQTVLTIEAGPPPIEVLVSLTACTEG